MQIKYILEAVDKITPSLNKIKNSFSNLSLDVDKLKNKINVLSFDKLNNSINNFGKSIRNAGLEFSPMSFGLGMLGKKAIQESANFESLNMSIEALTNKQIAPQLVADLEKMAKLSPAYGINDLTKSAKLLLGYKVKSEDVISTLQSIADITSVTGADLWGVSKAYGQVMTKTKLMAGENLQFTENGIGVFNLLEKSLGKTAKQLTKMQEQGKITSEMLANAFKKATSEGGQFENGMAKMGDTLNGQFAALGDNISQALRKVGDEMVKTVGGKKIIKDLSDAIDRLTKFFLELPDPMKKFIIYAGIIGTVLAPVLLGFGQLVITFSILGGSFAFLTRGVMLLTGAFFGLGAPILAVVAALTVAIGLIVKYWDKVKNVWSNIKQFSGFGGADINLNETQTINTSNIKQFSGFGGADINLNETQQINTSNINSNKFQFAGALDIFTEKGTTATFTPITKMSPAFNVGINSIYAK